MRTLVIVMITAAAAAARADEPPRVFHVPAAEATANAPFTLVARVDRAWTQALEVHYRSAGDAAFVTVALERTARDGEFAATIPGDVVHPPGFEYFIDGADEAGARVLHFASAADPHLVAVEEDDLTRLRREELGRLHGRRAQVHVAGEYVDFGARNVNGMAVALDDRYYRIDADFTYRLLSFPLHSLRFGFTRLLGDTPATARGDGVCDPSHEDTPGSCTATAGIPGAGWFEVRLRASALVDVDLRGLVAATKNGFGFGARAELRIGPELGSHVAVGGEAIAETGAEGFIRLGWDTVPAFPMAATIALTNFPAWHRAIAVRLLYDVSHPFGNGLRLGLRAGYQARDEGIGGATLGLNTSWDF